jgi:hypothetical protein
MVQTPKAYWVPEESRKLHDYYPFTYLIMAYWLEITWL